MSQRLFHTYKAALNSNDFCDWLLGILEPGLYRGFDTFTPSTLNFTLGHGTGIEQTEENLTLSNPTGIILTKQGVVVQEDATITGLSCATNAANAFERIDMVYMDHQDVNTIGGQAATYGVVTGPNGGPAMSALPNPERQILLGTISIPASAATLAAATWTPEKTPSLGGKGLLANYPELEQTFAGLFSVNTFTKMQKFAQSATAITVTSGKAILNNDGNVFVRTAGGATVNEIEDRGNGTIIALTKTGAGGAMNLVLNQAPAASGLRIRCKELEDYGTTQVAVNTGGTPVLLQQINNEWHILSAMDDLFGIIQALEAEITVLEAGGDADWIAYDSYTKYRKDAQGWVHLQGHIGAGATLVTNATGTTALTLPVGYRPASQQTFKMDWSDPPSMQAWSTLTIETTGEVTFAMFTGAGTARQARLTISFKAA